MAWIRGIGFWGSEGPPNTRRRNGNSEIRTCFRGEEHSDQHVGGGRIPDPDPEGVILGRSGARQELTSMKMFLSGDEALPMTLPHVEDGIGRKSGLVGRPRSGSAVFTHGGESGNDFI